MNFLHDIIWHDGKFLGIDWSVWKGIGLLGTLIFSSRFFVQWYATEKKKQVVIPVIFWWQSLIGTLLMLLYSLRQLDSVFILAYIFSWIPYMRNLIIHYRYENAHKGCDGC